MKLKWIHTVLLAGVVLAGATGASAQSQAPPAPSGDAAPPGPGFGPGFRPYGAFGFGRFEMGLHGEVVKGAPYSAQVVNETNQTLGDGSHIRRQSTGSVYRDSAGRERREMSYAVVGALTGSAQAPGAVFINDPVAGYHYMLHASEKAADRISLHAAGSAWQHSGGKDSDSDPSRHGGAQVTKESLGMQTIDGLQAEGTRITKTIPVGQIGNDHAIQIVIERWYSAQLQTVILSKHTDPWLGEVSFRLTNISRAEPLSSLFQVPADYTVTDRQAPHGPRGGRAPNPTPND
jgi:hypothetical protein